VRCGFWFIQAKGFNPQLDIPNWDSLGWAGRLVDWFAVGWGRGAAAASGAGNPELRVL